MNAVFSVIIPSRNRPALLRRAIESVVAQKFERKEIIVVDDGSNGDHALAYQGLEQEFAGRIAFLKLPHRPLGHGQSYAINCGASRAQGEYFCFLDDDDFWIDADHLSRAHAVLADAPEADVYLTNQEAWTTSGRIDRPVWIEQLAEIIKKDRKPDNNGAYRVTIENLLDCNGFCHLNTTIVRRSLFEEIGGLDEGIRYECDRDFYLRILDSSHVIAFHPAVTSRHNVPDATKADNMSTLVTDVRKRLYQLTVLDKSAVFSKHMKIQEHCHVHKGYAMKRIAESLAADGDHRRAFEYAREALAVNFSWKWFVFTVLEMVKAFVRKFSRWKERFIV